MKKIARIEEINEWLDCKKATYYTGGDQRWLRDGIIWQRLIGPEDSSDLIFGIAKLEPGQIHLLHHHEGASELYYVLEGTGKFAIDDEIFEGRPGTGFYMPPPTKHRILNDGDKTLVLFFAYNQPHYSTFLDE